MPAAETEGGGQHCGEYEKGNDQDIESLGGRNQGSKIGKRKREKESM